MQGTLYTQARHRPTTGKKWLFKASPFFFTHPWSIAAKPYFSAKQYFNPGTSSQHYPPEYDYYLPCVFKCTIFQPFGHRVHPQSLLQNDGFLVIISQVSNEECRKIKTCAKKKWLASLKYGSYLFIENPVNFNMYTRWCKSVNTVKRFLCGQQLTRCAIF